MLTISFCLIGITGLTKTFLLHQCRKPQNLVVNEIKRLRYMSKSLLHVAEPKNSRDKIAEVLTLVEVKKVVQSLIWDLEFIRIWKISRINAIAYLVMASNICCNAISSYRIKFCRSRDYASEDGSDFFMNSPSSAPIRSHRSVMASSTWRRQMSSSRKYATSVSREASSGRSS